MPSAIIVKPQTQIDLVSHAAKKFASNTKAKNTRRAYKSAFNDFTVYCADKDRKFLPASPATVADYISDLAEFGNAKISTLKVRLAAISLAHKLQGLSDPTQDESVRSVLDGISREKHNRQRQAAPLMKSDLVKIVSAVPVKLADYRNRTILIIGWFGAFRRSELVNIAVDDIEIDETRMKITVPFSKTDQYGKGEIKIMPSLKDKNLCPVTALRQWLEQSNIADGFVFRKINRWGKIGKGRPGREHIFSHVVTTIVKTAVAGIGLDSKKYSAHSLRAGFITEASLLGYDALAISKISLHKSLDTVAKYERSAGVKAIEIIKAMVGEAVVKKVMECRQLYDLSGGPPLE